MSEQKQTVPKYRDKKEALKARRDDKRQRWQPKS